MWSEYGYSIASKYRGKCMVSLLNSPKTPTQIAVENNFHLVHVSRALKELSEKELVYCATPELVKGRIYKLTNLGVTVAKNIKNS